MTPVHPTPRSPALGVLAALMIVAGLAVFGAVRAAGSDVLVTSSVRIVVPDDLDVTSPGRWTLNAFDLAGERANEVAPEVEAETSIDDSSVIELRATGSDVDQVEAVIRTMRTVVDDRIESNSVSYVPSTGSVSTSTERVSVGLAMLTHAALGVGFCLLIALQGLSVTSSAPAGSVGELAAPLGWWIGPLVASGLAAGAVLLGSLGLGRVIDVALILVFCAMMFRLASRIDALIALGWAWLVAPLLARLLDWLGNSFDPRPISLLPLLGSVVMWSRWHGPARSMLERRARVLPAMLVIGGVGVVFGLVDGRWRAETVGMMLWAAPLLVAAVIVAAPSNDRDDVTSAVFGWIYGSAVAAATIAILQWALLPAWDEQWIREAVINSVGNPERRSFRPFGPLNAPAVLAVWLAAGALIGLLRRRSRFVVGLIVVALMISEQRTAWVALVVALAVVGLTSRVLRQQVVAAVLVLALAGGLATLLSDRAFDKLEQTVLHLGTDTSLTSRVEAHEFALRNDLWTITGAGLGSVGVGATAEDGSRRPVDGVLPRTAIRLGGPLTVAYLGLLASVVFFNRPGHDTTRDHSVAWAVVVFCLVAALGTDPLSGSAAVIGWSMIGVLLAIDRVPADRPTTSDT